MRNGLPWECKKAITQIITDRNADMNTDKGNLSSYDSCNNTSRDPNEITGLINGAAMNVSNTLRPGFLEKVYENALRHELLKLRYKVEQQKQLPIFYAGIVIGTYSADLFVEEQIPVELNATRALDSSHFNQTLNELAASCQRLGLLLNFGTPRIEIKRVINDYNSTKSS
jgi:GxxExxY protein